MILLVAQHYPLLFGLLVITIKVTKHRCCNLQEQRKARKNHNGGVAGNGGCDEDDEDRPQILRMSARQAGESRVDTSKEANL